MKLKKNLKSGPVIDKGMVSLLLKMSPEERVLANDNAIRAILELKNAFKNPKH